MVARRKSVLGSVLRAAGQQAKENAFAREQALLDVVDDTFQVPQVQLASRMPGAESEEDYELEQPEPDPPDGGGEITFEIPAIAAGPARVTKPKAPRIYSILEYIESSWGVQLKLYPVQRFIVKLYYNIPLEDKVKTISISDMFNTKILYNFTEKEYLQYLFQEGRCNIGEQDHERRELLLAVGRRSGKSALSGLFASYEVYRLLNLQNPQSYYGLPGGDRIQLISIGTDKDQAGILFNNVTSHLSRCDYFAPYIANNNQSMIQFRTPADIARYGNTSRHENGKFVSFNGKATIRVTFKSCIAQGLRGFGNVVVIMDEMAHFKAKGQASADEVYEAVTPSTAAYSPKDPEDSTKPIGPVESRIICISSPLNKSGKFYDLFQLAMSRREGSENMLAIQAPTWEVNPSIESSYYRQKFHANPTVFMTEHGAKFSEKLYGWITDEDLFQNIDLKLEPRRIGAARVPHYMGIDLGLVDDGTAIVITHVERDRIVVDYYEIWYAGMSWQDANPQLVGVEPPTEYAKRLQDERRLDFEEISKWVIALSKRFHIYEGLFDRWSGIPLEQALHKAAYRQFTSTFFTPLVRSQMYQAVKLMLIDGRCRIFSRLGPQEEKTLPKHVGLVGELQSLQAEQVTRNIVNVAAPNRPGCHDDLSDAFVRSVWLAMQHLDNTHHIAGTSRAALLGVPPSTPVQNGAMARYQVARARAHGGFGDRPNVRMLQKLRTRGGGVSRGRR